MCAFVGTHRHDIGGWVDPAGAAIIDFTETAYNLGLDGQQWLPKLLRDGVEFIGHGLGLAGLTCRRGVDRGEFVIEQVHVESCPDDFMQSVMKAQLEVPREFLWEMSRPTHPKTLSEAAAENLAGFHDVMRHFTHVEDGLGMSAFDPDGHGVYLIAPLRERTSLTTRERERLQMVASHFGAGYRLRRSLGRPSSSRPPKTTLPHRAEAVLDPKDFRVTDAAGDAKACDSIEGLREAAKHIDRARGHMRENDPQAALELWKALVRGRWSMVDWFDSDSRRFVLAVPNEPKVKDPRGLTKQEAQVVSFLTMGHTSKLIGYQLGLSQARVSALVSSAMHKLGVRTRAQLVKKWRDFAGMATG
ncbi:MAG: LuxR C-terminal-related transcriptional regulator [Myxococcales bacterium]|nr:LuxR C-terminal-related transcriptional regulator [Myxococcales bacterium]